ncbi:hypothetical protein AU476_33295 [Cupriavidus sp. UYMSc13B]|nr:hypothetical protein AU476_33295 [Cupriavidus sp. UYMSc13B]
MQKQRNGTLVAMGLTTLLLAACGGGSENPDEGNGGGPPAATNQLDAGCLAAPAVGQQVTATLTAGPMVRVATFQAKAIGKTSFDGGNYDTLELKLLDGFYDWGGKDARIYIDPTSPMFPIGVTDYSHSGSVNYNKYRRFTYTDTVTGQTGTPGLVGMKPNETRTFTMAEANATDLATKPQPALKPITRVANVAVQYVGREDVTAQGVTYKGACKLALHYERKDPNSMYPLPVLEGTTWLAPGAGIVKLSGAPLVGVDTVTAETTGILAAH